MVERRVCSFCGNEIEPGTGKMYVKIDGTVFNFCKNKCQKNMIELRRVPRKTAWTQASMREKSTKLAGKKKAPSKKRGKGAKTGASKKVAKPPVKKKTAPKPPGKPPVKKGGQKAKGKTSLEKTTSKSKKGSGKSAEEKTTSKSE
jgi:large subunit ribosomal protein L24e